MRRILITIVCSTFLLTSCSVYKIDVQQGNTLEEKKVARLVPGMSQQQVQFLMGSPMLKDPFHPNRWDYVYSITPGGGEMQKHHLTLYFENRILVSIDKSHLNPALMDGKVRPKKIKTE